jgi:mono/diheme cytochrome c family protein
MRRVIPVRTQVTRFGAALVLLAACARGAEPADTSPLAQGSRYVNDAAFRRRVLEASLVNPKNGYSQLRLAQYRDDAWGALPEWNPGVMPVAPKTSAAPTEALPSIQIDAVPWTTDALVALGREAFSKYPAQFQPSLRVGLAAPAQYGLWESPDRVGGAVWAAVPGGSPMLAMTCASCHAAASASGDIVDGLPNAQLDMSGMLSASGEGNPQAPAWGRGRVDVTSDGIDNPAGLPDLRPIRSERYLHHDGTVRNGLIELAIRIETLIITSSGETIRPPRKLAFALAMYLWQLNPRATRAPDESSLRGSKVFAARCAACHIGPDVSGELIPLDVVGTDPSVGLSPERTTGSYRVPSLRGVGDRAPLLASGQVPNVEALLDPMRSEPGHRSGLELAAGDRQDLLAFLHTLE